MYKRRLWPWFALGSGTLFVMILGSALAGLFIDSRWGNVLLAVCSNDDCRNRYSKHHRILPDRLPSKAEEMSKGSG